MRRALIGICLLAAACQLAGPPQLVRDGAGMFSDEARAAAESRLRALAVEHGLWAFVITDPEGDPPRMLDEPMEEADSRGVPAVAILFGSDPVRIVGAGYSRLSFDGRESGLDPPGIGADIPVDAADVALERVVEYLESWVTMPPPADPPGVRPPLEAPSGTP